MSERFAADHVEISTVLFRYARAIDSKDFAALAAVFAPDAVIDYAVPGGTKLPFAEMVPWLRQSLALFRRTQHTVTNPIIEIDGDGARSTAYLTATHEQVGKTGRRTTFVDHGIYSDEWVRSCEGWRIRVRRLERIFLHGEFQSPDECKRFPADEDPAPPAGNRLRR